MMNMNIGTPGLPPTIRTATPGQGTPGQAASKTPLTTTGNPLLKGFTNADLANAIINNPKMSNKEYLPGLEASIGKPITEVPRDLLEQLYTGFVANGLLAPITQKSDYQALYSNRDLINAGLKNSIQAEAQNNAKALAATLTNEWKPRPEQAQRDKLQLTYFDLGDTLMVATKNLKDLQALAQSKNPPKDIQVNMRLAQADVAKAKKAVDSFHPQILKTKLPTTPELNDLMMAYGMRGFNMPTEIKNAARNMIGGFHDGVYPPKNEIKAMIAKIKSAPVPTEPARVVPKQVDPTLTQSWKPTPEQARRDSLQIAYFDQGTKLTTATNNLKDLQALAQSNRPPKDIKVKIDLAQAEVAKAKKAVDGFLPALNNTKLPVTPELNNLMMAYGLSGRNISPAIKEDAHKMLFSSLGGTYPPKNEINAMIAKIKAAS